MSAYTEEEVFENKFVIPSPDNQDKHFEWLYFKGGDTIKFNQIETVVAVFTFGNYDAESDSWTFDDYSGTSEEEYKNFLEDVGDVVNGAGGFFGFYAQNGNQAWRGTRFNIVGSLGDKLSDTVGTDNVFKAGDLIVAYVQPPIEEEDNMRDALRSTNEYSIEDILTKAQSKDPIDKDTLETSFPDIYKKIQEAENKDRSVFFVDYLENPEFNHAYDSENDSLDAVLGVAFTTNSGSRSGVPNHLLGIGFEYKEETKEEEEYQEETKEEEAPAPSRFQNITGDTDFREESITSPVQIRASHDVSFQDSSFDSTVDFDVNRLNLENITGNGQIHVYNTALRASNALGFSISQGKFADFKFGR